MKKTCFAICLAFVSSAAFAQEAVPVPAAPPAATPGAPVPREDYFPALPPSRKCEKNDLRGVWRLTRVYEKPLGPESGAFSAEPFQYIYFGDDGIFNSYASARNTDSLPAVTDKLKARDASRYQQFVPHESGMIYFYDNGVASRTLACFVVANGTGTFTAGQLLLMPPVDEAMGTRMVKVYERANTNPGRPVKQMRPGDGTAAAPDDAALKKKKKKKRKRGQK